MRAHSAPAGSGSSLAAGARRRAVRPRRRPDHHDQRLLRRPRQLRPCGGPPPTPATGGRPRSGRPSPTPRRPAGSATGAATSARPPAPTSARRGLPTTSCRSWSRTTSPTGTTAAGTPAAAPRSRAAYDAWIAAFASGIGSRPAVVVLEPDSLGDYELHEPGPDHRAQGHAERTRSPSSTAKAPNTWVYLDAGNPGWASAATMARRLHAAGSAAGPRLRRSTSPTTSPPAENTAYGNAVNSALSARYGYTKPFVVDTSRNGNGSNGQWCNPVGRRIGTPTQRGGGAEMLLWIKVPGESDGNCGVGSRLLGRTVPARGRLQDDLRLLILDSRQRP